MGDPQESSRERKHDRVEAVESVLDSVDPALEEHAYPVNSEDLSAQYGETVLELPNETESLGSVFDRLEDDEYESPMDVKEAVLRSVSDASPDPTVAGGDREPQPGAQGAPEEVREDLETEEVAEATAPGTPTDVEGEASDVGTPADAAAEPEADAAEPGDELTPETTEADEFAPGDTVEDRDREGDGRAAAERTEGEPGTWEGAAEEPGDPAEPTAEPTEEELDPEERGAGRPEGEARGAPDGASGERNESGSGAGAEAEAGEERDEDDDSAGAEEVDVEYEDVVDEAAEEEADDDAAEERTGS